MAWLRDVGPSLRTRIVVRPLGRVCKLRERVERCGGGMNCRTHAYRRKKRAVVGNWLVCIGLLLVLECAVTANMGENSSARKYEK